METDIMTLEEVAAYLKVKPQTMYKWAQERRIPAAKLGKEWRFRKSIIDRWFLSHIDDKFNGVIGVVDQEDRDETDSVEEAKTEES